MKDKVILWEDRNSSCICSAWPALHKQSQDIKAYSRPFLFDEGLNAQSIDYHYYAIGLSRPCTFMNDTIISVFTYALYLN